MPSKLPPHETGNGVQGHETMDDSEVASSYQFELPNDAGSEEIGRYAVRMQQRCSQILSEMQEFQDYLKDSKKPARATCPKVLKLAIQTELRSLDKLVKADAGDPKTSHRLRSSNLIFYNALWSVAKSCTAVIAFRKSVSRNVSKGSSGPHSNQYKTVVDIIADNGLEWIKVSTVTEKRVIWDLAKAGWPSSDESEDEEESSQDDSSDGLLKQAEVLLRASRAQRIRYRYPTVKLVLPRIKATPDSKEVLNVLQQIRKLGVIVQTAEDLPPALPIAEALEKMAAERPEPLSATLNIDCTILLAFVSDISHGVVDPQHWHNDMIASQMKKETEEPLLPKSLWPITASKELVCTREAAETTQKLVNIIGTDTERKRTDLLFNTNNLSPEHLRQQFQELSTYPIPSTWNVPVKIIDVDLATTISQCPAGAQRVADNISPVNQSVFLYGWSAGLTTISHNASVAKLIQSILEEHRSDEELRGPDIWLGPSSRSLVGKEKERRGA